MEQPDFRKIAAQLRQPQGEDGKETARRMAESNAFMIRACIDSLSLKDRDEVLELGPGGGSHLPYLLSRRQTIRYTGADISETMVEAALSFNREAVEAGKARFDLVQAEAGKVVFPYEADIFDHIFTVNTLYFWDDAPGQAAELYRILKPGGVLVICFATEAFMKTLPFTRYDFRLYTAATARELMEQSGFRILDISEQAETLTGFDGMPIERDFVLLHASK